MENIKKNLSKSIIFLTKFLNNSIPLFHDKIINFMKFDFDKNQSIPQIKSHYEQNKLYINNFVNYTQSCNLITIIGHEILMDLDNTISTINKNKETILKNIKILLDSIKSLYNPLDIFNKYQLLGNIGNNKIKTISDIIDFVKLNEKNIENNYKSLSQTKEGKYEDIDEIISEPSVISSQFAVESGAIPLMVAKGVSTFGKILPFASSSYSSYDDDDEYEYYGDDENTIDMIHGNNENFLVGNSCKRQHKLSFIKLETAIRNDDGSDNYKNVIIVPLFAKINELKNPSILLNKMKINDSLKYSNKQLKDALNSLKTYLKSHSKKYITSSNNKYINSDYTIKKSILKNECTFKIGKCEDIVNDIKDCIDDLNNLDHTIIFLEICSEFKKINSIKKESELQQYINITIENINDLQSHENIYMRKITKQNILSKCEAILIFNKELKQMIKNFIKNNEIKCNSFNNSNIPKETSNDLLECISDQLNKNEKLVPKIVEIENKFISTAKSVMSLCDTINYFIQPGQTVTCIKHPMKIINTIFYTDLIYVINNKRFKHDGISKELNKIKREYPAYFKKMYDENITKNKIDDVINIYV